VAAFVGCASNPGTPACLVTGLYVLTLVAADDASAACGGYSGATVTEQVTDIAPDTPDGGTVVTLGVTWPSSAGRTSEAWTQCTTQVISCQQFTTTCVQGSNFLVLYLSNDADGPGWVQYGAGRGQQCAGNYTIVRRTDPS
jgi:hypothetical protein